MWFPGPNAVVSGGYQESSGYGYSQGASVSQAMSFASEKKLIGDYNVHDDTWAQDPGHV